MLDIHNKFIYNGKADKKNNIIDIQELEQKRTELKLSYILVKSGTRIYLEEGSKANVMLYEGVYTNSENDKVPRTRRR